MDVFNDIITAILTSAIVSSAVSFLLKTWLETRLKHHFLLELEKQRHSHETELERIKNELTIKTEITHELTERRITAYPKIVELVYRIRNMAREMANTEDTSSALFDELRARTRELENNLYAYRMDLERDNIFILVHTYKNMVRTFDRLVEDHNHCLGRGEKNQAHQVYEQLCGLYLEIEAQHKPIIDRLSGVVALDPEPTDSTKVHERG